MKVPPSIETLRLVLRPFAPGDLARLAEIMSDPDVMHYLPGGTPRTREQAAKTLDFIFGHWEQHGYGCHLRLAARETMFALQIERE